jgi:hypothetical protein
MTVASARVQTVLTLPLYPLHLKQFRPTLLWTECQELGAKTPFSIVGLDVYRNNMGERTLAMTATIDRSCLKLNELDTWHVLTEGVSWLHSQPQYLHFVPMLQKRVYRRFPCISETHVMNFGTMCVCVASGKRVEYGNGKHNRKVFRPPAACSSHVLYLGQHPSLVSQCVTEIHNISRCQLRWTRWNGDVESCQAFNLLYSIIQPYSGQFLQGPQRGT